MKRTYIQRSQTATKVTSYKEKESDFFGTVITNKRTRIIKNSEQLVKGRTAKNNRIAKVQSICNNIEANFMKQAEAERKKKYNKKRNSKKYAKRKSK